MDKEKAEILSRLKDFIKKHGVEKTILFGSVARGELRESSDLDVILVSEEFEEKSALKRPVPFRLSLWTFFATHQRSLRKRRSRLRL